MQRRFGSVMTFTCRPTLRLSESGAKMDITGPRGSESGTRENEEPSSPAAHRGPSPRVFVIDDEDFIRDLYKDVLESQGITVFSAPNGEEALEIFKTLKHRPDVVIMDYRMPGKDGIETTKEMLRLDPNVPIIFSSADESIREMALEAGAISFWAKPFPVGMLVNAMLDILEGKKKSSV